MKISYTLFLTAMVTITMERCRTEYLLVAVDDAEQKAPASKEDPGQCIGVCGGICPPCKSEPIPKEDPGQCIGVCGGICPPCKSEPIPKEDPGQCIGVCGGICPPCKSEPLPKEDPEGTDDKDGPIISHGSPTGFTIPDEIPKQEGALPTNDDQSAYDCCNAAGVHILCMGLCLKDLDELPRARSLWEIPSVCSNHETAIKKCRQPDVPKMKAPAPKTKAGKPAVKGKASLPIAKSQMQSRGQCTTPCTGNECCCGRNTCASSCC